MNKISFKKFVKTGVHMFIENVFSNFISCVFCNNKIIFHEDMKNVITPEFKFNNKDRYKLVGKFNLNSYENIISMFDSNYMIFIYFEDEYGKDKITIFLLWDYMLETLIIYDRVYNRSHKKVLLYKFKNNLLKM